MSRALFVAAIIAAASLLHAEEYFPQDSRRFAQSPQAVVLMDLSKMEPTAALITGKRQKGKWKMIPFETAEMKGTALSI